MNCHDDAILPLTKIALFECDIFESEFHVEVPCGTILRGDGQIHYRYLLLQKNFEKSANEI